MARTIARTPSAVPAISGVRWSTWSFISERM
jgi:hypothetical protein